MNNSNQPIEKELATGPSTRTPSSPGHSWFKPLMTSVALAALVTSASTAHAAAQAQLTPSFSDVAVGDVFEIVLGGFGFDRTSNGKTIGNVTGGQNLNFSFSSGLLEVVSITIDPRWTFAAGNRPGTFDQAAGTITGMAFGTFPATLDDSFKIATLTLRALAGGTASLSLDAAKFIGQVNGSAGQLITADLGQASVNVVPEPGQWALLIAGLGAIGLRLRRA